MKTWVKLYTEINRDPDIGTLTWEQRGIWTALLALCGEFDNRDGDEIETGEMDAPARICWHLRIDAQVLQTALDAFQEREMVHIEDGIVFLTHYSDRQQRAPSARPSAVNERVQAYRESRRVTPESDVVTPEVKRECNEDVTREKRPVTPSDTDKIRLDPDSDSEKIILEPPPDEIRALPAASTPPSALNISPIRDKPDFTHISRPPFKPLSLPPSHPPGNVELSQPEIDHIVDHTVGVWSVIANNLPSQDDRVKIKSWGAVWGYMHVDQAFEAANGKYKTLPEIYNSLEAHQVQQSVM